MIEPIFIIELVFSCLSEMGLTGLKSRCQQDCVPSGGSKEKYFSLHFLASEGCPYSLIHVPSSSQQLQGKSLSPSSLTDSASSAT